MRSPHLFLRTCGLIALVVAQVSFSFAAEAPKTERAYLSGLGPKDAVPWEFSVTAGRRAGEWTTIPVPSNWEQQGFGTYNYGQTENKSSEHGLYRRHFNVSEAWKGKRIRLVFEGVMTDATVKVNGQPAGPTHIGAFYRFHYDITSLVKLGADADNIVEVDVAKTSSDRLTEDAERSADYWVFGGIFRPVWLEASPVEAIDHVAIDARADGTFNADVTIAGDREATHVDGQIVAADGSAVGAPFSSKIPGGGAGRVRVSTKIDAPRQWTAETPHLYSVRLALWKNDEVVHTTTERFGFRTFEVRAGDGLYLNGQRILLKGVNRHSFRPETARTLSREDCYDDVRLIKEMNMNAVRMSHYPPDKAFLEACDELGLYVLDELSGWQHAHGTVVGRLLIREMIERDVNHPSILFWDNGNEGGWNRDLDREFALYDPQQRRVLHPWELHDDVDTKHYPIYADVVKRLAGRHLFMPTEFVHALYDGGGAAGLEDYWTAIASSPVGAGGFIWVFADEGIARTDQGGRIDVFSTYAPDGLVGPRHEKEGSFYTVRDLWSPVQIAPPVLDEAFNGHLQVTNRYDFTSLAQCAISWKLVRFPGPNDVSRDTSTVAEGSASSPGIQPHTAGTLALTLPKTWRDADALVLTVKDPAGAEVWTWTWATKKAGDVSSKQHAMVTPKNSSAQAAPKVETGAGEIRLVAGEFAASFDPTSGLLKSLRRGNSTSALANGPRLTFARPGSAGEVQWLTFAQNDTQAHRHALSAPQLANTVEVELAFEKNIAYAGFKLEITSDGQQWKTIFDASRRSGDGKSYNFPPQPVLAVRLSNVRRADGSPINVNSVRLGYAPARFPAATGATTKVASGTERDPGSGEMVAWIETSGGAGGLARARWTLRGDGSLRLDYSYGLEGEYLYHGITFDHAEEKMKNLRWLGAGPYRVWQNRLRGTWLGVHEIEHNDLQPGEAFSYPEFQGFFGDLRWSQLDTAGGKLTISSATPGLYLRVGTPRVSHQNTTVEFPAGDLSVMHAIPAIGSKFITPEKSGPASEPAKATGTYSGSLEFSFEPSTNSKL